MTARVQWIWLFAWLAATVFLVGFYRPLDWRETATQLRATHGAWWSLAVALNLLILVTWTRLWRRLTPAPATSARREMGGIVALAAAGMNTLPFMGGHALGAGLLATRGRLSAGATATVMMLDQIFEGAAKLSVLALALLAAPLPDWMQRTAASIALLVLLAAPAIAWIATRDPTRIPPWLARWTAHFRSMRRPRDWAVGLGWSLAAKAAEAAAILAAQRACGVELPVTTVVVVLAAVNLATMVSVSPGNLGVYETAAYAIYLSLGVDPAQALSLSLVQHAAYLVAMIVPGYVLTGWRALTSSRASA